MRRNIRIFSSTIAILAALSGCASFQQANQINNQAVGVAQGSAPAPTPIIETSDAPYLLGTSVQLTQATPPILDVPITFRHGRAEPLRQIAAEFSQDTGIAVDVSLLSGVGDGEASNSSTASMGGLPPPPSALLAAVSQGSSGTDDPVISMWYHGTRKGFLDALAARAGLYWSFTDGRVKLFNQEAKTFIIPALNRTTTSQSDINATAGSSASSSGLGAGMGGQVGGGTSSGSTNNDGSTSVNTSSTTNVWKGIEATAKIVGGGANVSADPQTGTLTVVGTPDQIQQVSDWVNFLSATLTKTVSVSIHIYDVQLNNEQNYGINPTVAFENSAKSLGLTVSGASIPAVQGTATPFKFGASILDTATGGAGEFKGTSGAVQALATLGNVTEVFSRTITTLNGQQAPIQNGTNTGYLAESELSTAANVGTTGAALPGSVTTGFTGTVTPQVVGNKILIGLDFQIANLVSLTTESSGQTTIQVPTTDQTVVDQSAAIPNGATLMITGYQEADTSTTHNGVGSPYMPLLGGGGDASVKRFLIAIVVTAGTI